MIVEVRHNPTGEIRSFDYESSYRITSSSGYDDYIWTEGNYSCDCNRALFFERAIGNGDPDVPCSSGVYSLRITERGVVVLNEFD